MLKNIYKYNVLVNSWFLIVIREKLNEEKLKIYAKAYKFIIIVIIIIINLRL
jgi:hypothetical protein